MNNSRREAITKITEALSDLHGQLESLLGEEQAHFDNMSESLQGGDKGIAALNEAISSLDETIVTLRVR